MITLSLIQSNLIWEDKNANLQQFEQKIAALAGKTQLILLPEMFSTGFSMRPEALAEPMEGSSVEWMKKMAKQYRVVLAGSLIIQQDTDNGTRYFNRFLWVLPNGQLGYYDKRHRFAYAGEDQHYSAGHRRLIASVNGWRVNCQVCYDLRFPVWARQSPAGTHEYDLLIYVANWPEKRSHAWKTLLQARAIENQCYVAGVNRVGLDGNGIAHSGDSMLIDPLGQVLAQLENVEDSITMTLNREDLVAIREKFPFWRDADPFLLLSDQDQG